MASVFLTTTKKWKGKGIGAYERVHKSAIDDLHHQHTLTDDVESADLIIFVEYDGEDPFLGRVRKHPFVSKYRERCFCVSERDHTFPFLPGVYTSVPASWYDPDRIRGGFYTARGIWNRHLRSVPISGTESYLFSFAGSFRTSPIRKKLKYLNSHNKSVIVNSLDDKMNNEEYANLLLDSKFVLCPRGISPSSIRIFETIKCGRIPVIISDEWIPPEGPDWDLFSVQIEESEIVNIPDILSSYCTDKIRDMSFLAIDAWEKYFSPKSFFHTYTEMCISIMKRRSFPERINRIKLLFQLIHNPYRYEYLKHLMHKIK